MSARSRPEVPLADTWDPDSLYPGDGAFEAARDGLARRIGTLDRFRGRLDRSATDLAHALETISEVRKDLARLHVYASLRSDEDTTVAARRADRQRIQRLATEFAKRIAYLRPELLGLDVDRREAFLASEPKLAPFAHGLRDLDRHRAHVRTSGEETIVAEAGLLTRGPSTLFGLLHNAELPRPSVVLSDGRRVVLTPAEFARHRTTRNRRDRELLYTGYYGAYAPFRETLGSNLDQTLKSHLFRARVRRHASCLASALHADAVPTRVYEHTIERVHAMLPRFHRLFGLRARALGIDRLEYHDLHCPLAEPNRAHYPIETARQVLVASCEPLGPDYVRLVRRALEDRWIDWWPTPAKRAGAYSNGAAYDAHPYVLLNYHEDHESLSTLAHEMGHAMHSYLANSAQPYPTSGYSILVAEVASTFNEALLHEHLYDRADSSEERIFLLALWLDRVRSTLFRQALFAEFELAVHRATEGGEAVTGESCSALYLELLRRYHGHDHGVVHVCERYDIEWAAVPHFHMDFYVYQYATGIVAATHLAASVLGSEPGARERFLELLRAGGSEHPLVLLRRAGVDLESAAPFDRTAQVLDERLDALEGLIEARNRTGRREKAVRVRRPRRSGRSS